MKTLPFLYKRTATTVCKHSSQFAHEHVVYLPLSPHLLSLLLLLLPSPPRRLVTAQLVDAVGAEKWASLDTKSRIAAENSMFNITPDPNCVSPPRNLLPISEITRARTTKKKAMQEAAAGGEANADGISGAAAGAATALFQEATASRNVAAGNSLDANSTSTNSVGGAGGAVR